MQILNAYSIVYSIEQPAIGQIPQEPKAFYSGASLLPKLFGLVLFDKLYGEFLSHSQKRRKIFDLLILFVQSKQKYNFALKLSDKLGNSIYKEQTEYYKHIN